MDKQSFVEHNLIHTVRALFPRVDRLEYRHFTDEKLGDADSVFAYDVCGKMITHVNVTADSNIAIVRDVLNKLENVI